jgi:stearoyl-CoA desaturase (delta-9 desaturase)
MTGEGWHNNHHHYPSSVRQGFRWWEVDVTYYLLWLMERVGLVWDLRRPPADVVAGSPVN